MKKLKFTLAYLFIAAYFTGLGQCGPTVPLYVIDLSSNADTTWTLKEVDALPRSGQCCSASASSECIQFVITLNPNAAGIFFDYDGAGAFGSLNWKVDCGAAHSLKDTICITDPGPFTLTFCKPGNDNGNYTLTSVSKPTFPDDQVVPLNCAQPVHVAGVNATSVTWQSISPGAPGAYNSLLSCVNCLDPVYTPNPSGPAVVEYRVCGYPVLENCLGNIEFCDTVKFTSLDSVKLNVTPITPSFCSGGNVILTAAATGGDGNFSYSWYNSSLTLVGTGPTYNATVAGSYTCKVKDGNYDPLYCDQINKTVMVIEALPPAVNAGDDQILCANSPVANISGSIQNASGGTWTGGTGTYSPSNTNLTMSYTPTTAEIDAGSVILTLTSNGAGSSCVNTNDKIQLFYIDTIKTNIADTVLGCFGATTLINPTITGGLAPFTYSWTNGETTASSMLGAGTHCLMITDNNGCQVTQCLSITTSPELNLTMSSTPVSINGGSDGTATATPSGGTAPYLYTWSNAGTNPTETGLSYGIYRVLITDNAGCEHEGSVVVNEPRCNGFSLTTSSTDVLCNGDSTGTVTVATVGGLAPFTYEWNDLASQTTSTATNVSVGVYEVSVMDDNGCYSISTASVFQPSALSNTMTHNDVSILGESDGDAQSNVMGGFGAYTYLWDNSDVTADISNVTAGWYHLQVSDDNNCILLDSVLINEPPCNQFQIYVSSVSPVCNGDNTGTANLTISNGTGPFSIVWSTGETNVMSISGALAGIHTVEVRDNQGCYTFLNFGISQPSPLSIGLASTPSKCNGSNNGTIDMSVSGGTYPYYYYNWSNGQTSEDLSSLIPGTYSVTVQDQNGCIASNSTTLTDPDLLTVIVDSTKNVTCFNGTDGAIYISLTGGNPTYTYDWSNGATSQDLTGLDIGGYILDIMDGNFCKLKQPLTLLISEPAEVLADTIIVNCPLPGELQTLVDISPIGGTSDYAISTDGGSSWGSYGVYSVMLNTGQSYNIMIKDVNNCISPVYAISIAPTLSIDDVDFNVCYAIGQTDEIVNVNIIGGISDYYVSSDNGVTYGSQGTISISAPINNSYDIVAMDASGCISLPFPIVLPDIFDVNVTVTSDYNGQDVSCFGFNDGEATAVPSGGTGVVTYDWSNGCVDAINSNLVAGTYNLTIEDAAGCTVDAVFTLTEPSEINQSYIVSNYSSGDNISCYGYDDGFIDFTLTGGSGGYMYDWNNDGTGDFDDDEDLSDITAGVYLLTGMDLNGCIINASVTLVEPSGPNQSILTSIHPSGHSISCYNSNDGWIDFTVIGGAAPFTFDWDNDGLGDNDDDEDLSNLPAGTYNLTATDVNGCSLFQTVILSQPDTLMLSGAIDDAKCFNDLNGSIDIAVSGGTLPYVHNWSTGENTEDLSQLGNGVYSVTIVDSMGCTQIGQYTVDHPDSLIIDLSSPVNFNEDNIDFFGGNNGEINATVIGGTLPYTHDWSNGESYEDLSLLVAGTYELWVTDENGCSAKASIQLRQPLELELPSAFSPNTDNSNDRYVIHGIDAYPDNTFTVINRWGNVVHTSNGYSNTWGGENSDGKLLPDGVYFAILVINGGEIERTTYVQIKTH